MELVFIIALICFLLTICKDIIKLLKISRLFVRTKSPRIAKLQDELKEAQSNLEETRNATNTRGEYAQMVRVMRAEQRVNDIKSELLLVKKMSQLKGSSIEIAVGYGAKAILSLMLFYTCLIHRYDPVLVFGEQINLQPLQGLLSSPTGVANAISVPMWTFACHTFFRLTYKTILRTVQ